MKIMLAGLVALVALAWGWSIAAAGAVPEVGALWAVRQEALYLSGYLSIAMMSLAVFLAVRPAWIETPLGGMDRAYRAHKWAGILAVAFGIIHWLVEMADDILKALVGREGRPPKEQYGGLLEALRDLAEDMGEWAIYAVIAMLALTLWKRFPYRPWRFLHRAMPAVYLMLAFHAALLAPAAYWMQPAGWLLALLLALGAYGSLCSLAGRIGNSRRVQGRIEAVERPAADVVTVRCRLGAGWRGHHAGQFAFVTFDEGEGAHPFTIASADAGDGRVAFQIKALGDYTRQLADSLRVGQVVAVEGPYGRFDMARRDRKAHQVWIAGGIGVTPFLAWLESLQAQPEQAPSADLHYCTRDRESDPFVARLEALCASLPAIRLHVHGSRQGERANPAGMVAGKEGSRRVEVWFCGPVGLAKRIEEGLRGAWEGKLRLHREAFEMR